MVDAHVHVIPAGDWPEPPASAAGEFRDVERILEETRADRVLLAPWVRLLGVDDEALSDALAELVSDRVAVLGAGSPASR